ncbi:MAG TPA: GFA family protein [Pseudomonadales bacterium]
MAATGKCLCGAVTFTAEDVEPEVHACHCAMCRSWAGAPMLAVNAGKVSFRGEADLGRYQSSEWAERGFCTRCGSNLFYRLKQDGRYFMCMGAFDDQSGFRMASEIYIDQKPPGYAFAGDHPRQTRDEFMASLPQS